MVKNKRGWIRILEATIAVMIVSGVLIITYSNRIQIDKTTTNKNIQLIQQKILSDINTNATLRKLVLKDGGQIDSRIETEYLKNLFPPNTGYKLIKCDLGATSCKLSGPDFEKTLGKEVLVEETILAYEPGDNSMPQKVRIFAWIDR